MYIINLLTESGSITRQGLLSVCAFIVALLFAVIFHELAHGLSALAFGDNTSKLDGRLTLNPAKHFDLIGFVMMVIVGFGWARPVRVNVNNFKHKRVGMVVVSLAGVLTNLLLSFIFCGVYFIAKLYAVTDASSYLLYFLSRLCTLGLSINISFALFNLLPIFPLDGYRLLSCFIPQENKFMTVLRQYSFPIIMALLVLNWVMPAYSPFNWYINGLGNAIVRLFTSFWGNLLW